LPRSRPSGPGAAVALPDALTPAVLAVCVWGAASDEWAAAIVPSLVAAVFVGCSYGLWIRRGRPWHDRLAIVLLLPALAAALWLAIGGAVLGDRHGDGGRLLLEVGPGLALTGLVCAVAGYHGRHHPDDAA
jgi:peptidoglycan/LPS O-acetylase OafA/YrhL